MHKSGSLQKKDSKVKSIAPSNKKTSKKLHKLSAKKLSTKKRLGMGLSQDETPVGQITMQTVAGFATINIPQSIQSSSKTPKSTQSASEPSQYTTTTLQSFNHMTRARGLHGAKGNKNIHHTALRKMTTLHKKSISLSLRKQKMRLSNIPTTATQSAGIMTNAKFQGFALRKIQLKKNLLSNDISINSFSTNAENDGFTGGVQSSVGKNAPSVDPDELANLLKQFESMGNQEENDPYEQARQNTSKHWQDTPTPDGWTPSESDPTLVMPTGPGPEHTKPHLRTRVDTEVTKGPKKKMSFQTETSQMLDIVTNSLYTDKEVFLRELVSNGSDALEKARYLGTRNQLVDSDIPLEIRIFVDEDKKTITLQDTGIGMTHDELVSHLGTIARSGSKQWVKDMKSTTATDDIIGQFGVGFYSAFMVGQRLEVFSKSGKKTPKSGKAAEGGVDPDESAFSAEELQEHSQGHYWTSTGTGEYEISQADGVERGTKIIIHLRDDTTHFGTRQALEAILKKYSNFVGFPIYLNGLRVNTVQAIWNMNRNDVTEEQHAEFYRYLANAYDKPTFRMHFNADVPLQINALFYFPERHMEKYGMGRMEPGTSLYSRKVLIKPKAKGLLPEYLRFVQGVVDSEDIPLNISRENMQDSLLISRISSVLTKRVIKHLQDEAKKNPTQYNTWFNEFGSFIREGICSDFTHKTELARLLRFDSSDPNVSPDMPTSLDDYIGRMPPDQTQIYFLNAPNRKSAIESPYYEQIKSSGYEVLFLYHPLDDFAMQNLREFNRRKLVSAESQSVETSLQQQQKQLQLEQEYADLASYVKTILADKVTTVTITDQVSKYPAYIVDHESSSMRKMMKMMDTQTMFGTEGSMPIPKQKLNINPKHPIMAKLTVIKDKQPKVAKAVMEQVFDNALMAADLLDNPRDMLPRMQNILEMALDPTLVQQFEQENKKQ